MSEQSAYEPSRRTVIRGGAIGAGALLGAMGLGAGTTAATAQASVAESAPAASPGDPAGGGDRMFLKLDGINGDSQYKGLEDWIELTEFSWGAQAARATGRGRAGRPRPLDFTFSALSSVASPLLFRGVITGEVIDTGGLVVTRAGDAGPAVQFVKIDLADVVLDFYKQDGSFADGSVRDNGTLTFGRIRFSFYPQDRTGGLGEPVIVEWDTRSSKW